MELGNNFISEDMLYINSEGDFFKLTVDAENPQSVYFSFILSEHKEKEKKPPQIRIEYLIANGFSPFYYAGDILTDLILKSLQ